MLVFFLVFLILLGKILLNFASLISLQRWVLDIVRSIFYIYTIGVMFVFQLLFLLLHLVKRKRSAIFIDTIRRLFVGSLQEV
jgi:hypothetical protein